MTLLKKIIYFFTITILILGFGIYSAFLFYVPKKLTSVQNLTKIENILSQKAGLPVKINGAKIKTFWNFGIDIKIKDLYTKDNSKTLLEVKDLSYNANLFNPEHAALNIKSINADIKSLKSHFQNNKPSKAQVFDIKYFPVLNVNSGHLELDKNAYIDIKDIKSVKRGRCINTTLRANLKTPYSKSAITFGESGFISYCAGKINFRDLSVKVQNSRIILSGTPEDLHLKADNLPAKELESNFIYFYKLKHPNKKNFIENFTNFKGTLDIDLHYKKGKFNGKAIAKDLAADFSIYKIPVYLPQTVFYFKDKNIKAKTKGFIGKEPATTDFNLNGLATKNLDVRGNVWTKLSKNFSKRYFQPVEIKGNVGVHIQYHNYNSGHTDVYYSLTVPKGSNLLSTYGNLNNTDKIRKLTLYTKKYGNPIKIKDFEYLIYHNSMWQKLFTAQGSINKYNKKYKLEKIHFKTNASIPVAFIQSFIKNILTNGTFNGDIIFDNIAKKITGKVNLQNVSHSSYLFLKDTTVDVINNNIRVSSNGTLYGSDMKLDANIENNFNKQILIHDIDIYLEKFLVHRGKISRVQLNNNPHSHHSDILPLITVEKGKLHVDKIYHSKFDVHNVDIYGTLKDEIAYIKIPHAHYANGLLSAKGIYNLCNHSSNIYFFASDIDSNIVATNFFKLPNQIQGNAFATLYLETKNKLNDIHAKASFAITDGFLPKIGSQEFRIRGSKSKFKKRLRDIKITLSQITNIDFSKPNLFYSNLYGSFYINNNQLDNVRVFSKSDFLSMFIEGTYNIDYEEGKLCIWGKQNKTEAKKIRILKIPFSWIYRLVFKPESTLYFYNDKVKLIPDIKTKAGDDVSTFRIFVNGNLNSNDKLNVELKDLR